jgi:rod shape determining protein RodA
MAFEAVDTRARGLRPPRREQAGGFLTLIRGLDWVLLAATIALVAYGLWALEGITRYDGGDAATRQALYAAVGGILFVAATLINPAVYQRFSRVIYLAILVLMAVVLVADATRGSRRWIEIGFFRFQPSEFGKVLFTLFIAAFLADRAKRIGELRVPLSAIAVGSVPIVLVFIQPDIGTALVYIASLGAVLLLAGVRWRHLAVIGSVGLVVVLAILWWLPAAGVNVLKPYQEARLTGFTHPDSDPRGATYNINQSITAVGAGGVSGRGVDGATQTSLDYLPEHATDFAFASLAEQRGFFGASALLLLYLLVVWRGLKIVAGASSLFMAVVAGGLVFGLVFQVFVNVGMTIGVAPITGIPLPFVSVGGSSMISNLAALGILQAIHIRGRRRRP